MFTFSPSHINQRPVVYLAPRSWSFGTSCSPRGAALRTWHGSAWRCWSCGRNSCCGATGSSWCGLVKENHRKTIGKPWENHGKTMENHGKTIGQPWENHGKTIGKPWKTMGKPWENGGLPSSKQSKSDWSHGPVEIVDLPINGMVDLSSSLC